MASLLAVFLDAKLLVDNYPLDGDVMSAIRACIVALLLFSLAFVYFLRQEEEPFLTNATGATTAALGGISLVLMAQLVAEPTWNVAGPLLMMFSGAFVLGAATLAMIWGHWYLVNPRLPEQPLIEMTLLTLAALLFEIAIIAVNAVVPAREDIASDALLAVDLVENLGFWLRLGIGFIFPVVLVYLAYRSSKERAMMSATGLLYIAVGAVLAGEALGRGLLFVTGSAV
jgi:hypothetical protein